MEWQLGIVIVIIIWTVSGVSAGGVAAAVRTFSSPVVSFRFIPLD
jgi:hypothetical protein